MLSSDYIWDHQMACTWAGRLIAYFKLPENNSGMLQVATWAAGAKFDMVIVG